MVDRPSYKQTLFDRLGPDAAHSVRSMIYGLVLGPIFFMLLFGVGSVHLHLGGWQNLLFALVGGVVMGVAVAKVPVMFGDSAGKGASVVVAGGNTTPYTEQYSYQQTLVMQGRLDEALSTYEAIIAEPDSTNDVRIRAAELYAREAKKFERAAELFRAVSRDPRCTVGEEVYCANRLVDLLNGPLAQPGRALVELRRLVDRYPKSIIGERARQALRSLKAAPNAKDEPNFLAP